jgi:hypothetical protein
MIQGGDDSQLLVCEGRFCLSHSITEHAIARPALHLKQFVIPSKARNPLFASDASNAWPALYLKQLVIPSKARNPLFASDATNA